MSERQPGRQPTPITAAILAMSIGESRLFPGVSVERVRYSFKTARKAGVFFRCRSRNLGARVERIK